MAFLIETAKIQAELQELAGSEKVTVKLNKRQDAASHLICRDTKRGATNELLLNPNKIRSQANLDEQVDLAKEELAR